MSDLRQSTAVTVHVGPALDATDGVTPETGLAAGTVDELVVYKHEATAATDISGTTTMTHRAGGTYTVTLSTSDVGTLGHLRVYVRDDSVCLPFWRDFTVLSPAEYDAKYGTNRRSADTTTPSKFARCPLPTIWNPTRAVTTVPAWASGELYWGYPSVLRDSAGRAIDLRTLYRDFPYRHMVALSTDHADSPHKGGIALYFFDDDPGKLVSLDDAVSAGVFSYLGTSGTDFPSANPVIDSDDATDATRQLEVPSLFIRPSDGKLTLAAHAVHSTGQHEHIWTTDDGLNWDYVGLFDEHASGLDHHCGYGGYAIEGDQLASINLNGDGQPNPWSVYSSSDGTAVSSSIERNLSNPYSDARGIDLSATHFYKLDGEWWTLAARKVIGSSGTTLGQSELVLFPWRRESSTDLWDAFQSAGGRGIVLTHCNSLSGNADADGWITGCMFYIDGRWFMLATARNEAGTANSLVTLEGAFESRYSGVAGELEKAFGAGITTWPAVEEGTLLSTSPNSHGTINGSVPVAESLVPNDPLPALTFDGSISNYVDLKQISNIFRVWDDPITLVFIIQSTETTNVQFGAFESGNNAFVVGLNGTNGNITIYRKITGGNQQFRAATDTGIFDGEKHVVMVTIGQSVAESEILVDGDSFSLSIIGGNDNTPTPMDALNYDFYWGALNNTGTAETAIDGTLSPPILIRRELSEPEKAYLNYLLKHGSQYVGRAHRMADYTDRGKVSAGANRGEEMDLVDAPNATAITAVQNGLATPGDEMDLVDAPNATAVTALQNGVATSAKQDSMESTLGVVETDTSGNIPSLITSLNDPTTAEIRDAILNRVLSGNHDTSDTPGAFLQNMDAAVSGVDVGSTPIAVDDRDLESSNRWIAEGTNDSGVVGRGDKSVNIGASPLFGVDFHRFLDKISSIETPVIASGTAGGVTFGTAGKRQTLALCEITGVTAGTYTIKWEVNDQDGATHICLTTLTVPVAAS